MKKLLVFDCDGVMFSSREANRAYYNTLLAHFQCPPMDEAEVDHVHIHNMYESVRHIFRNHHHISMDEVNAWRETLDYAPYLQYMIMEPDLPEFLGRIKPHMHTAISTNRTDTMDLILDTFQLRHWFDMVVTVMNAPRPKPAPDGLLMILEHFRLQPEEAIYIGDSEIDRLHCAGAGVDLISFKNKAMQAKYHVESFMEILSLPPFERI